MKLKDIFLVFVLGAIWGFSSCSSEEIIDTPQNGEATLSISLSVNDTQTKAGEQIATSEELRINNCHIAVFDNESGTTNGKFITSFDFSQGNGLTGDNNNYACTPQLIRTFGVKRSVKFLAIANIDKTVNQLEDVSGESYSEYLNAIVTSSSFNSTNLVKVGEKEILLENGKSYPVEIKLTQLTARFDFEGVTMSSSSSSKATSSSPSYKFESLFKNSIKDEYQSVMQSYYKLGEWEDNYYYEKEKYKYYYKRTGKRLVGIKITRTQLQSSGLQFHNKKVSGLNGKSIIGAYSSGVNDQYSNLGVEIPFDKTFYTYNNAKDLKVTVVGSKSTGSTDVFYGFIEQQQEEWWSWSPEVSNLDENSEVYDKDQVTVQVNNITEWINKSSGSSNDETFTLDLSKVAFENGKRYTIKGTYNPTVNAEIDWAVQDWSSKENINIGFN